MRSRLRLSLAMIVRNEAENLSRCLGSVLDLVDEMVVVDTGSTDRTTKIARQLGARIYRFPWQNDFAAARNAALSYVKGEWVLVLDADEQLLPGIIPQLQAALSEPDYLVINLLRHEVGAPQAPYSLVSRLFRNHPDLRYDRPYHELIDESVEQLRQREPHWQVITLPGVALAHYGYQPEVVQNRQKEQRARRILEGHLLNQPTDSYAASKLGALYVEAGEVMRGLQLLTTALERHPPEASVRYELHYHLGLAYTRLGQSLPAQNHYQYALNEPLSPLLKLGAYNNLGTLLQAQGDLIGARALYETMLRLDPKLAVAHYNLGLTLKSLGLTTEALYAYEQALILNPNYAEAHQNLGVALFHQGKVSQGIQSLQRAIALYAKTNPAEAKRLQVGLQDLGLK